MNSFLVLIKKSYPNHCERDQKLMANAISSWFYEHSPVEKMTLINRIKAAIAVLRG